VKLRAGAALHPALEENEMNLTSPAADAADFPNCDINNAGVNNDGSINNFDIDPS
jgi:hypothetical protein